MADERLIFMHGFEREDVLKILRAIKTLVDDPRGVAFTTSTPTNLEWKVKDLISEVRKEHEYMMKNPPRAKPADPDLKPF